MYFISVILYLLYRLISILEKTIDSQQKELAERLFKGAYHVAYKKGTFEYPIPVDWEVLDNGKVKMKFNMKVKIRNSEGLEACFIDRFFANNINKKMIIEAMGYEFFHLLKYFFIHIFLKTWME